LGTEITFENPNFSNLGAHMRYAAALSLPLVEKGRHADATGVVVCSTGPTMEDPEVVADVLHLHRELGYDVLALKEAVGWLADEHGVVAKYSASMDPGGARQVARTPARPGTTYCLASSCHPELYDHLLSSGCRVEVFHSACGYTEQRPVPGFVLDLTPDQKSIVVGPHEMLTNEGYPFVPVCTELKDEVSLYAELFGGRADVMQGGFALVNRALSLCQYMGYPRPVVLAGADFGWRENAAKQAHYASFVEVGPLYEDYMHDEGAVDGRPWRTRPDQLASAVDVARRAKKGEVLLLGDTLAAAISKREDEFVDRLVRF